MDAQQTIALLIGQQAIQIAALQAQVEALKAKLAEQEKGEAE